MTPPPLFPVLSHIPNDLADLLRLLADPSRQLQTGADAERSVPPVSGLAHESPVSLPALFHPMLQAQ